MQVCTPVLPPGLTHEAAVKKQRELLDAVISEQRITSYLAWYYTPMAREFSNHLHPKTVVYDCMDELSAFAGAPQAMRDNEQELFEHADLVFTGGVSLYGAKRKQHSSVHLFPSSVDANHFARARTLLKDPEDQASISRPRIGYAGVIDERMDVALLSEAAALRPDWQFVLLGPIVKIDQYLLPRRPNIHYLGMKSYDDLPAYLAGWSIGMLPFALNEATRYISPTKTPEYLAAGLRVISTPIRDVITPYGDLGLVCVAEDAAHFVRIADALLTSPQSTRFRQSADAFLAKSSWDRTWNAMSQLIEDAAVQVPQTEVLAAAAKGASHV